MAGDDQQARWCIPETYGVPVEEIQEGIRNGVRKVNIDTDNRLAFTAAVREAAMADPSNFDPRHFNKPARKYMKQVCLDRYQQFWAAGNASKISSRASLTTPAFAKAPWIPRLP